MVELSISLPRSRMFLGTLSLSTSNYPTQEQTLNSLQVSSSLTPHISHSQRV